MERVNYKIIPVEFPNDGATFVSVADGAGGYNLYVNTLIPGAEETVRALVDLAQME